MADVTVDMKPMEKAPYDPNDIPDAVKKRVAAVEALYSGGEQQQPPGTSESQAPVPQGTPTPQAPTPAVSSPTPAPSAPADENAETWKHRYLAMQGRYASATKTIGEMQGQMEQLGSELMQATQRPPQRRQRPTAQQPSSRDHLTAEDVQNYGAELIEVTQRAARQAIEPKLSVLEQQNQELQRRLANEARLRLDQQVEIAVPDYREIDRDPRWHRWLLGIDLYSGRVRQQLLNEAISAANAPRVISFFNGFKADSAATGHTETAPRSQQAAPPREPVIPLSSLAAPGRARPASGGDTNFPPDKPTYTRAQIRDLYRAHQKGAYVGREAEWARQDADIIAAGREGRIR